MSNQTAVIEEKGHADLAQVRYSCHVSLVRLWSKAALASFEIPADSGIPWCRDFGISPMLSLEKIGRYVWISQIGRVILVSDDRLDWDYHCILNERSSHV